MSLSFTETSDLDMLDNLGSCYDPKLDPQISVTYTQTSRNLHYFLRDKMAAYDEKLFSKAQPLRGSTPINSDLADIVDNRTLYKTNKCGLTHGTLDWAWNLAGLGTEVQCHFFTAKKGQLGADLRAWDFQYGREIGETSWIEILKSIKEIDKCPDDYNKNDFITHLDVAINFLRDRSQGNLKDIPFALALDLEETGGNIVSETGSRIWGDQMKRIICGDRFWWENDAVFREGTN